MEKALILKIVDQNNEIMSRMGCMQATIKSLDDKIKLQQVENKQLEQRIRAVNTKLDSKCYPMQKLQRKTFFKQLVDYTKDATIVIVAFWSIYQFLKMRGF